jgi:hypothetical protein
MPNPWPEGLTPKEILGFLTKPDLCVEWFSGMMEQVGVRPVGSLCHRHVPEGAAARRKGEDERDLGANTGIPRLLGCLRSQP